jgi:hypothetical protein
MEYERLDEDSSETAICLFTAIILLAVALLKLNEFNSEAEVERAHRIDQCTFVARRRFNAVGITDDDGKSCSIRMRFQDNVGLSPVIYWHNVPIDQLPRSL